MSRFEGNGEFREEPGTQEWVEEGAEWGYERTSGSEHIGMVMKSKTHLMGNQHHPSGTTIPSTTIQLSRH